MRKSRSPHGERGLKCTVAQAVESHPRSLPTRGAWIEIKWIAELQAKTSSRSPHGERGLKLFSAVLGLIQLVVAPHTGSVD